MKEIIQHINEHTGASIRKICAVLQYSCSSYYASSRPTPTQLQDKVLGDEIEKIFLSHRRRYGYRRVIDDLHDLNLTCSAARARRLMKERGLLAIQPKNFVPKTSDGRADKPSQNLLSGQPLPDGPNKVWAGDITFIPTSRGWRYLAVVIDLFSRKIVGWALADHMRADLVCDAFKKALGSRHNYRGVIFHSDRGSQYGSIKFRALLSEAGARQSMSARANPYDNAWTESFIGTYKHEYVQGGEFENAAGVREAAFDYFAGYYNTSRLHSAIGYKTPNEYELELLTQN